VSICGYNSTLRRIGEITRSLEPQSAIRPMLRTSRVKTFAIVSASEVSSGPHIRRACYICDAFPQRHISVALFGYYHKLMKILVFTSLFPNRASPNFAIFILQRISHLARSGNLVHVIAPVPYFPSWIRSERWGKYGSLPTTEEIQGLTIHHPRYPLLPGLLMPLHGVLMCLGSVLTVRRLHREYQFDCIDAHYVYPDGFAASLLGKIVRLPVIVSARGTDINVFPSFRTIRPLIVWTLHHAAGIIAVSQALKTAVAGLGPPPEKIRVIPNGVDSIRFHSIPESAARERLGLPKDARILVSVASLTEGKNHASLISALARMDGNSPGPDKAFIIGDGPLKPQLERLIGRLGLHERVILLGAKPNEELALWFSAADASCLVSSREGWPNVIMESLACGTPVVATRTGGVPEILSSPDLGILVEPDIDSIAAGLQAAFSKKWDRRALARRAQTRSWDDVAREVVEYLKLQVSAVSTTSAGK
jgi:teichuronic acid biosynthesis glycosyltransferase TuaC